MIKEAVTAKESLSGLSGVLLTWIGAWINEANTILALLATLLGLVVVFYSIVNARKKSKLLDLEIMEKQKDLGI